jgi:hypothetical protein
VRNHDQEFTISRSHSLKRGPDFFSVDITQAHEGELEPPATDEWSSFEHGPVGGGS